MDFNLISFILISLPEKYIIFDALSISLFDIKKFIAKFADNKPIIPADVPKTPTVSHLGQSNSFSEGNTHLKHRWLFLRFLNKIKFPS